MGRGAVPAEWRMLWQRPSVTDPGVSAILDEYVSTSLQWGTVVLNSLDMGASMAGWSEGLAGGVTAQTELGGCGLAATIEI